eukprot:CAMPEP_0178899470 /NCGR_PEP_ID=MMETSP0786-20121207/2920_1 /TAXON_ID=186022 /ORGANISM="Thalassionema frauenfeldii, Strain CCMP 1798" /LENGTH=45 /DNA_ID= /DNA_START= /DNA_END= /DNA_ORIENTATION=
MVRVGCLDLDLAGSLMETLLEVLLVPWYSDLDSVQGLEKGKLAMA